MELRLRQADRLATVGRMAANLAHEIRNPLASLTGGVEALAEPIPDEVRQRLTRIVLAESERLDAILAGFLEYAEPARLAPDTINVADTLEDVLGLLAAGPATGAVRIAREFSPPPLHWRVDPQQFRQALWMLCLNAIDAMPDGGELRVGAAVRPGALEVSVSDTGDAIAPPDLPHVFEPFAPIRPGQGGLGLALAHRIAQAHGGGIEVRSTPGGGTTFILTLPPCHG
jgi:two-component system sensor histidine kinase PilS (NtrC family)